MANPKSTPSRRAELRAMYARLQREIDRSRSELWLTYFGELAALNPHGTAKPFITKFDEAWRRSMLPNSERDDMDADGNYRIGVQP